MHYILKISVGDHLHLATEQVVCTEFLCCTMQTQKNVPHTAMLLLLLS